MTSIIKIEQKIFKKFNILLFFFLLKIKNAYNYFIGYFKVHVYRLMFIGDNFFFYFKFYRNDIVKSSI